MPRPPRFGCCSKVIGPCPSDEAIRTPLCVFIYGASMLGEANWSNELRPCRH